MVREAILRIPKASGALFGEVWDEHPARAEAAKFPFHDESSPLALQAELDQTGKIVVAAENQAQTDTPARKFLIWGTDQWESSSEPVVLEALTGSDVLKPGTATRVSVGELENYNKRAAEANLHRVALTVLVDGKSLGTLKLIEPD